MYFDGSNDLGLQNVRIQGGYGDKGTSWGSKRHGTNAASGTCYWSKLDSLLIDNKWLRTDKKTTIQIKKGRPIIQYLNIKYDQDENTIAHDLYFRNSANVTIKGDHIAELLIP